MRSTLFLLLAAAAGPALCQEQEIHRALIQRDQQSAEFAAQLRGGVQARQQLEALHAAQLRDAMIPLSPEPAVANALLPYQRSTMAEERVLRFAPPVVRVPSAEPPLPLPGGPRPGVDPVAPEGIGR
jgi:hypothetical protein